MKLRRKQIVRHNMVHLMPQIISRYQEQWLIATQQQKTVGIDTQIG